MRCMVGKQGAGVSVGGPASRGAGAEEAGGEGHALHNIFYLHVMCTAYMAAAYWSGATHLCLHTGQGSNQ